MPISTETGDQLWDIEGFTSVDLYEGTAGNNPGLQNFWEDGLCESFLFHEVVFTPLLPPPILQAREGLICFEMDALHQEHEVVHDPLQEFEQLKRLGFWNSRNIAIRPDSFGVPLTKYRLAGPFSWETPIYRFYTDYFDTAERNLNNSVTGRRIFAYFDIGKLYSHLYRSRREVAVNYKGEIDARVTTISTTSNGERVYHNYELDEQHNFWYQYDDNGQALVPDKVILEANPSSSALSNDSSVWDQYYNIRAYASDRITDEFILNRYHGVDGTLIRLPNFRDFSFNPEDLVLYNAWRTASGYSSLLTTDTISANMDSYMYELNPTTNYGSSTAIIVGYGTGGQRYHSIVSFDLSTITSLQNHQITSAVLKLRCLSDNGQNLEMQVYSVYASWAEMEVTWNQRLSGVLWNEFGGDKGKMAGRVHMVSGSSFIYVDVTDVVRDWVKNRYDNYGFLLIPLYVTASIYPTSFVFQAIEHVGTNEPKLVITHGDFPKINDNAPVSASNPYIRDDQTLWAWRSSLVNEFVTAISPLDETIVITNSDITTEVDTNIDGYGPTSWDGVEMAYERTETTDYTRTVGVPNSIVYQSAQWGHHLSTLRHYNIAISFDLLNSRYTMTRIDKLIEQIRTLDIDKYIILDFGILANTSILDGTIRPRDVEELIRAAIKNDLPWIVHGWDYFNRQDNEATFWAAVSQALNDMGNTWELEQWVPPEAFNIQMSPETARSTSLNLQHTIISSSRSSGRKLPLATVQMTWRPLDLTEMGLLQRAYQFGRVFQWNIEGKYDIPSCLWEPALAITIGGERRYYGTHRSWLAGTVRVQLNGTEIYHNDPNYSWTVNYEEGYIVFTNTVPNPSDEIKLQYQCRMTLMIQSIQPADTPELYRESLFLPVEVIFKEVR